MSNSYDYLYTSDTVGRADFLAQDAIAPYRITSSSSIPALDFLFDYLPAERRDGFPQKYNSGGKTAIAGLPTEEEESRSTKVARQLSFAQGIPTIVRGELTAVTGKAKTGKTFLTTMLAAAAIRPQCVNGTDTAPTAYTTTDTIDQPAQNLPFRARTIDEQPLSVLWIDTEQSPASTKEILTERILPLANAEEKTTDEANETDADALTIFNFRSIPDYTARLAAVRTAIESHPADLVIIDGIRDLVSDINSYNEAQTVIGMLLKLAADYQTAIVCVLHQNKSPENNTMRGAIGTELTNKAFETFECSQDPDTHILSFAQTMTRRYTLPGRYCYTVDPRGLPIPTYDPATTPYAAALATPIPAPQTPTYTPPPTISNQDPATIIAQAFGSDQILEEDLFFQRLIPFGRTSYYTRRDFLRTCYDKGYIHKETNQNKNYYIRKI